MNARFAPTGLGVIPKFKNWLETEIVDKIWSSSSEPNPPPAAPSGVDWQMDREMQEELGKAMR